MSNQQHSEYKPSCLGPIPIDWEVKKGADISIKITKGSSPKWQGFQYQSQGLLFVTSENVRDGVLDVSDPKFLPIEFNQIQQSSILNRGDILINLVGASIGRSCIYTIDTLANINQAVCLLRLKNDVLNTFVINYLSLPTCIERMLNTKSASAQPNLTLENIRDFPVPIPPYMEQEAISKLLTTWDKAIEKTTQLITAKEQLKKWLMQHLLTGKKRLKGFTGKWKRVSAGEVFENVSLKGFDSEQLLSATQDKGIIPRNMLDGRVTMPAGETTSFKLVEIGDFVISLRSFQGGLEYSYYRGIVSPAYTVLKPKVKINDEFYKYYYKSYDFIGHLATAVIGIRDGKQVSYDEFCVVRIPNPSYEEQTAIANILQTADKEINLLKQKLAAYKEQKKGLMQVLLTGKVRLKTN